MIRKRVDSRLRIFPACLLILLAWATPSHAVIETYEFENAAQEERYQHFTEVLRCPKCQNQNLSGSDSAIAADLRRELAAQILAGKDDDEIVDFMVARFGDFVLYDPPFKASTWLLWLAPAALLLAGLATVFWLARRRDTDKEMEAVTAVFPAVSLSIADGLSKRQAMAGLVVAALIMMAISAALYLRYGAFESLRISQLTSQFYAEAAQAMREGREADPALARELLARLAQHKKRQDADITGSELQLLYLQGSLHVYLSEFEAAIPYYKDYLMVVPTDERVLTEYAQILYLAAGRQLTERVKFVAARALELNPHNQEILALLALQGQQGSE